MKKLLLLSAAVPFIMGTTSVKSFEFPEKLPYGEVSANVSYYSQYIWRGEQQNAGQSAVQGGFDYSLGLVDTYIDFYAGIWGSNVSGGTNSLSGNELDYYLSLIHIRAHETGCYLVFRLLRNQRHGAVAGRRKSRRAVSYTHLTLPTTVIV